MIKASLPQGGWNFLGLPDDLAAREGARAWVLPVPYEATTSYGAGTRNGPAAIIAASRQVEWYDRELGGEPVLGFGIHTLNPAPSVHRSPEAMVESVEQVVAELLGGASAPEVLAVVGGEHTLSAGVVRGLARSRGNGDLVAVQVDAHGDLREEYEGSRYSHACAARRILETCPVFQIGIRSICPEEEALRRASKHVRTVYGEEAASGDGYLRKLAAFVRGRTVYLTVDLDGLDPAIMPAVGTPEPGGLSWWQMLEIARVICREARRVPVFDVVELAPIAGMSAPDFLAARLVYKVIALAMENERRRKEKHGND